MTLTIPVVLKENLEAGRLVRIAHCWKITRVDGTIVYLTNHPHELVLADGQTYTPEESINTTAHQQYGDMTEANAEWRGAVGATFTYNDLVGHAWDNAAVIEYIVDPLYPFLGAFAERHMWMRQFALDSEQWTARVSCCVGWFQQQVARRAIRKCQVDVFSSGFGKCNLSDAAFVQNAVAVASVGSTYLELDMDPATVLSETVTNWYNDGKIEWLTGNNAGFLNEVRDHDNVTLSLQFPTPGAIQVGDTFKLWPGCNKDPGVANTTGHCKNKFNNLPNFQGYFTIPGSDVVKSKNAWTVLGLSD